MIPKNVPSSFDSMGGSLFWQKIMPRSVGLSR